MIKRILCLLIVIMLMLMCVGCSNEGNKEITDNRFVHVEGGWDDNGNRMVIIVDTETKVMYLIRRGGGITVMVDAEGKPLLYSEDLY